MGSTNKYTDEIDGKTYADCPKCGISSTLVGAGFATCLACETANRRKIKKALARMLRRRARR